MATVDICNFFLKKENHDMQVAVCTTSGKKDLLNYARENGFEVYSSFLVSKKSEFAVSVCGAKVFFGGLKYTKVKACGSMVAYCFSKKAVDFFTMHYN